MDRVKVATMGIISLETNAFELVSPPKIFSAFGSRMINATLVPMVTLFKILLENVSLSILTVWARITMGDVQLASLATCFSMVIV